VLNQRMHKIVNDDMLNQHNYALLKTIKFLVTIPSKKKKTLACGPYGYCSDTIFCEYDKDIEL